ncbi:uncharacterized protein HaLaN_11667, partial [Haematococcus lacustris]
MHEAEQLIGWARSRGMRGMLNAYNRLLAVYAGRGDMAAVKRVYKQLKEQRYLPDLGSSGAVQVTWNILVWGYAHAGDLATAKAVLGEAEDHGFKPDAWTWSSLLHRLSLEARLPPNAVVFNTLIRGYCKLGMWGQARAMQVLQDMRAAGCKPGVDTYTPLLEAAAEALGEEEPRQAISLVTDLP